jgi:hypothetical protein
MRPWVVLPIFCWATAARAADVGEIAVIADPGNVLSAISIPTSTYLERAACAFYADHQDRYDAIFVYTNRTLNAFNRNQQGWPVKRAALGLGRDLWPERSERFCSPRLRHAVKMGDIGSFPDDPDARYTAVPTFTLTGVQLMAHELGHQWMAAISFLDGSGRRRCLLRGYTGGEEPGGPIGNECDGQPLSSFNLHWSYFFSTGSVMYGNELRDLGGGRFEVSSPNPKFSPLDQYLMGLRAPEEVPPLFLLETGALSPESTEFPLPAGQTEIIEGERLDFTVADIIRAEGPRDPPRDHCHWKAAFVLIHDPDQPPTAAEIARVDRYRQRFESFYAEATDRRGSFDTTLKGSGIGTPECPAVGPPILDAGIRPDASPDATTSDDAEVDDDRGSTDRGSNPAPSVDDAGPPAQQEPKVLGLEDACACRDTGGANATPGSFALLACGLWIHRRRSSTRR